MKIEFYLNDKTDIDNLIRRLAVSITLYTFGIDLIYIDDMAYSLEEYRQALRNLGFKVLKE